MHFIDEVKIFVKSGDGGEGCVSFLRAANLPLGGPDGGDGGRGGSIILECVPGLNTLIDFRYKQHFKAPKGGHGMGSQRTGPSAADMVVPVPAGTQVFDEAGEELLYDITTPGQRVVLAKGGDGGLGNLHFKTSTNRAPRRATPGWPGEERWLWLRLKLLSDAGLVGMPNAGKSTFLSKVTRAKPKIADYPFTTLKPQLGVVYVDEREFVLADIPGLIEGAHEGQGLGDRFLKHIERCGVLLHLIDGTLDDVVDAYKTIRNELEQYNELLLEKDEVIAINKCDALTADVIKKKKAALEKATKEKVFAISTASGENLTEVLRALDKHVRAYRKLHAVPEPKKKSSYDAEG